MNDIMKLKTWLKVNKEIIKPLSRIRKHILSVTEDDISMCIKMTEDFVQYIDSMITSQDSKITIEIELEFKQYNNFDISKYMVPELTNLLINESEYKFEMQDCLVKYYNYVIEETSRYLNVYFLLEQKTL